MFSSLFGKKVTTIEKTKKAAVGTREQIELLQRKSDYLDKRIQKELADAKLCIKNKQQEKAKIHLARKARYIKQQDQLANQILNLEEMSFALENQQLVQEQITVMKTTKLVFKDLNTEKQRKEIEDLTDDIREHMEDVREISEALSEPIGNTADLDIDAELEELEQLDLDQDMLKINTPSPSVQETKTQEQIEEDQLQQLEREMATA